MRIYLHSFPYLSTDYSNVIDFHDNRSRQQFFESNIKLTLDNINIKYDSERTSVVVPLQVQDCRNYDYLHYVDSKNKPWYYFITNIEMVTENTTRFYLQLDIWTSYMFTYTILPSFVDRCHVPRWDGDKPTYNMENEEIGIGEYTLKETEDLYTMGDNIIVSTSNPIGFLPSLISNNGVGSGYGGKGNILQNTMSQLGFIFLKQVEGFTSKPLLLEGLYSLGYGIVEKFQNARYRVLYPSCTEIEASNILDDMMRNEFCKDVTNLLQNMGFDLGIFPINQYDVWCSIAMNYGTGGLQKTSAWKYFTQNPADVKGIADKIRNLSSYPSRRKLEGDIYEFSKYPTLEEKPISKYDGGSISGTVEGTGYIPSPYLNSGSGSSTQQQNIVNSARKLIGKPYVWGGNYPPLGNSKGTDCSGLCQWAYNDNGLGNLISGRWTTDTIINSGTSVSINELQLADMILTPGHVVLYAGMKNGKHYIVEAPRTGLNVREREYNIPSNVTGIRRLL